jgi:hypothetical protein
MKDRYQVGLKRGGSGATLSPTNNVIAPKAVVLQGILLGIRKNIVPCRAPGL